MRGLVYRVVGPPPDKNTPRSERLRWIRRLNWRCFAPLASLGAVLLLVWVPHLWYFAAGAVAIQAYTLMSISLKIRREERKEQVRTAS
jgi:hypothetical protein